MSRRNRRLHDVGPAPVECECPGQHGATLVDLLGVPQRPVLIGEQHQIPVAKPGLATRVVQQHHRQQAVRLGLIGQQLDQGVTEPQRLGRHVAATPVALVEDQIDDREHGSESIGQQVIGRHPEGNAGGLDLALGAYEPLRHGRFRHQERPGDLVGGQAAERAQRQCDLGLDRERRMTTREHELESLVAKGRRVHRLRPPLLQFQQLRLGDQRLVAADLVDGPVAGRRHQPGPRAGGISVAGPPLGSDREGLLGRFLGEVEVAEEADQGSEHPAPLVAERLLEDRHHCMMGRTSIAPPSRAAGIFAASSIAASRSSAS